MVADTRIKLSAASLKEKYPEAYFKAEDKWLNTICRKQGITNNMLRHQGYSLVKVAAQYNWVFSPTGEKL